MNEVSYVVAGESWELPLIARTEASLARQGIAASTYDFKARDYPCSYSRVVRRLIDAASADLVVLLRAGVIVDPTFRERLETYISEIDAADKVPYAAAHADRDCLLIDRRKLERGCFELPDPIARNLQRIDTSDRKPGYEKDPKGPSGLEAFVTLAGSDAFQKIGGLADPSSVEVPVRTLSGSELEQFETGWVYGFNTENPSVTKRRCGVRGVLKRPFRTVVAVGAGIKPWFIADACTASLQDLVIVDCNPSQLLFASRVHRLLPEADSWEGLVSTTRMRSNVPTARRAKQHEVTFERIKHRPPASSFGVHYLHADLMAQTFRTLEYLGQFAAPVLLWYSNTFALYNETRRIRHPGVEQSFVRLLRERFPGGRFLNGDT